MAITAYLVTTAIMRIAIAIVCYQLYFRNKSKISSYFGTFFLLTAFAGFARAYAAEFQSNALYFAYALMFSMGMVMLYHVFALIGIGWVKKTDAPIWLPILVTVVSAYASFVEGGIAVDGQFLPGQLFLMWFPAITFYIASYAFWKRGQGLNRTGRFIVGLGFFALATTFAVRYWFPLQSTVIFVNGTSTFLIALGWILCAYVKPKKANGSRKI